MSDPIIARPLAGAVAFQHTGEIAEWSQAAQLIAMGVGLTGSDDVIADMQAEGEGLHLAVPPSSEWLDRQGTWDDLSALLDDSPLTRLGRRYFDPISSGGIYFGDNSPDEERFFYRAAGAQLWNLARTRDSGVAAAVRLLVSSLYSESEIVRVAGAVALAPMLVNLGPVVESILVDGLLGDSVTVRTMAAHSLAAKYPEHRALRPLLGDPEPGDPEPTRTSITVHGTFARLRSDWWKPGSTFHTYLREECSDDLYAGTDHYRWDGRYDEACRDQAASDLAAWCDLHEVNRLDTVYAHSHGGNVALTAAQDHEVKMKLLVLLDTPARPRTEAEWESVYSNVRRIVSIRSRFDLVILGDRSRLRFDARIRQLLPPGLWFTHGSVLKPRVWKRNNLPNEIAYERGLATPTIRRRSKTAPK